MDQPSVAEAVKQICEEKGIAFEAVIEIIEAALAAAYRKDFGEKNQNIKVEFDLETGKSKIFDVKTVVEDVPQEELEALAAEAEEAAKEPKKSRIKETIKVEKEKPALAGGEAGVDDEAEEKHRFNPKTEIQISDAKKIQKNVELGEMITTQLKAPDEFGRMAAQTAKQVITQKVRESEREVMYQEFKDKQGEIIVGTVQRQEGRLVLVDLGRLTALLPPEEQIANERYIPGGHLKVYVISVASTTKGPEVIVSRAHPDIVKKLFVLEIPEIANCIVQIKGIAREAGSRTKIAVWTDEENIDPIGSCIGQRGARIQTIISELKGEKVDIIKYSEDPVEYISNALSPAKIVAIEINEETRIATAKVLEDQLSLAIGKAGQNVRLAARLTGWKINIVSSTDKAVAEEAAEAKPDQAREAKTVEVEPGAEPVVAEKSEKSESEETKKEKKATKKKAKAESLAVVKAGTAAGEPTEATGAEAKPKKRGRPKKTVAKTE